VADFNADGRPDLAVANFGSDDVSILLGLGDGTFADQVCYGAGNAPHCVAAADFNDDGHLDLAVANATSDDVSILLGLGDGTFADQVRYAAGDLPQSVAAGDFNADGHLDLAVANFDSDDVSILPGLGNGTFAAQVRYGTGDSPRSVATGDFNGDGHLDLAVANGFSDDVSILLGLGDGTFAAQVAYAAGDSPRSVAARDFNGDGHLDLAVANFVTNDVSILLGLGNGTFAAQVPYGAGNGPQSVAAGDFNGDGHLDLAVANFASDDVSILLGLGDGTFADQVRYGAGDGPLFVAAGDFNGDGRLDLAVANWLSNDVSILLNELDDVAPVSSVAALPATVYTTQFEVSWSGEDDAGGSGISRYDIYVSVDGGTFSLWHTAAEAGSAMYTGAFGHTYAFYSVAVDFAGNVEQAPTEADATTTVADITAPSSAVAALPATVYTTQFEVSWSGEDDAGGSGISRYDIYVSVDGGAFSLWHTAAEAGSAIYTGAFGHTYAFYSVAVDFAGNVEQTPADADTRTTVQDTVAPTATLQKPSMPKPATRFCTIRVKYRDNAAMNAATVDGNDVLIAGPRRFRALARLVSKTLSTNGRVVTATYRFAASGTWDADDNGIYAFWLQAKQVRDMAGNAISKQKLGTLKVLLR